MKRPRNSWAFLTVIVLWLAPSCARAQANRTNPFIWQVMLEYDIGRSNQTATYIDDTSIKLYSQDFQTVFIHNDLFGNNQRLLLDFGDSCPGTSIGDIQSLNGNTATSPSMMSQPSVALIQRSGRCERWSDKISTTQSLSSTYRLNIGAVLIYDNRSSSDVAIIRELPSNASYPTWAAPLPQERDASRMSDNNVAQSLGNVFVAVYFVPNAYGLALKDMVRNYTSTPSGSLKQRYVQIATYFHETTITTADNNDPTPSGDSDGAWSIFSGNKGYIAYLIAAIGVFLLLLLVLRCYRCARNFDNLIANRSERDAHSAMEDGAMGLHAISGVNRDKQHKMSLLKLNDMCPVETWKVDSTTNTVCAICLEELKELDNIRVLPCHHGFCVACIDVWLTKKASLCPICKYDCDPVEQEDPSSSSVPFDAMSEDRSASEHPITAQPGPSEGPTPVEPPHPPTSTHQGHPNGGHEQLTRHATPPKHEGSSNENTHSAA
ncbi:hypothetical protein BX666DRAFT_1998078 [Dichotomocladium elegans]|nr:hypothetical protein BX666DRAFT_1998078 [Dichotomocladium elegans]